MFEDPDLNTFVYILIGAAIALAILWHFVIQPMERRNHERKMALLQDRIKKHEESLESGTREADAPD